jgi:hypothetical protein
MSDPASKHSLVLEQLLQELPHALVLEPEQLRALMSDKSGHTSAGPPLCVVEALSIEDVVKVVTIASQHQIPLVTGTKQPRNRDCGSRLIPPVASGQRWGATSPQTPVACCA